MMSEVVDNLDDCSRRSSKEILINHSKLLKPPKPTQQESPLGKEKHLDPRPRTKISSHTDQQLMTLVKKLKNEISAVKLKLKK